MKINLTHGSKAIPEAVADGSLVDLTDLAKKCGMLYPAFMSSGLVAKYKAMDPEDGLFMKVSYYADLLCDYEYSIYGPVFSGDHVCILEPHEEFGHVVLILEQGKAEELGLKRTTGDRFEYSM